MVEKALKAKAKQVGMKKLDLFFKKKINLIKWRQKNNNFGARIYRRLFYGFVVEVNWFYMQLRLRDF